MQSVVMKSRVLMANGATMTEDEAIAQAHAFA